LQSLHLSKADHAFQEKRNDAFQVSGAMMVVFGLIFLLIGFVLGVPILWTIGMIVLIVGLVLWALGAAGHAVGGRRHYY
jgi:fatty acid desaturase